MQACGPISLEGPIRARLCGPIQFADGISGPLWERRAVGNLLTRAKGYTHTCASTFFAVALLTEIDWLLGFLIESVGVGGQREISVAWLPLSDPNSSSSSHLSILFFPKYHQVLPLSWAISLFESKTFSLPPLGTELYFSFLFFFPFCEFADMSSNPSKDGPSGTLLRWAATLWLSVLICVRLISLSGLMLLSE